MSKWKITTKITIWYAVFLIAISVVLVIALSYMSANSVRYAAESKVIEKIVNLRDHIEADGKEFIYDTSLNFYQDEIFISIYDKKGRLVLGRRPAEISKQVKFVNRECQEVRNYNREKWFVYDNKITIEGKKLWIRGMMKDVSGVEIAFAMPRYYFLLLPIVIIMALLGGYLITKRAFAPVREITRVSDEIQEDADLSRRIIIGSSRDELFELTESINGMIDKLERDMVREKQFSSDVSHELRTPISIIQAQSEYAIDNEDARVESLEIINKQAKRMSNLVSKLLMLSRSEAGRLKLDKEIINFSELIKDIAEQQQMIADEYNIRIKCEAEDNIKIQADEAMLIRIILNIVDNAIKYGKNPGGTIVLSLEKNGKNAICRITDDGPGIPKAEQKKIWNRFYQMDNARTDNASSGLGLAMVESLTKAMKGSVKLESEEGKGASFELKFKTV